MALPNALASLPEWVKPAVLDYKAAELAHLDALPPAVKRQLCRGSLADFERHKHGIRTYGEVAFTLAGVKPCTLLAHGADPHYFKGVAEGCLRPVMERHGLASHGFELHEIR